MKCLPCFPCFPCGDDSSDAMQSNDSTIISDPTESMLNECLGQNSDEEVEAYGACNCGCCDDCLCCNEFLLTVFTGTWSTLGAIATRLDKWVNAIPRLINCIVECCFCACKSDDKNDFSGQGAPFFSVVAFSTLAESLKLKTSHIYNLSLLAFFVFMSGASLYQYVFPISELNHDTDVDECRMWLIAISWHINCTFAIVYESICAIASNFVANMFSLGMVYFKLIPKRHRELSSRINSLRTTIKNVDSDGAKQYKQQLMKAYWDYILFASGLVVKHVLTLLPAIVINMLALVGDMSLKMKVFGFIIGMTGHFSAFIFPVYFLCDKLDPRAIRTSILGFIATNSWVNYIYNKLLCGGPCGPIVDRSKYYLLGHHLLNDRTPQRAAMLRRQLYNSKGCCGYLDRKKLTSVEDVTTALVRADREQSCWDIISQGWSNLTIKNCIYGVTWFFDSLVNVILGAAAALMVGGAFSGWFKNSVDEFYNLEHSWVYACLSDGLSLFAIIGITSYFGFGFGQKVHNFIKNIPRSIMQLPAFIKARPIFFMYSAVTLGLSVVLSYMAYATAYRMTKVSFSNGLWKYMKEPLLYITRAGLPIYMFQNWLGNFADIWGVGMAGWASICDSKWGKSIGLGSYRGEATLHESEELCTTVEQYGAGKTRLEVANFGRQFSMFYHNKDRVVTEEYEETGEINLGPDEEKVTLIGDSDMNSSKAPAEEESGEENQIADGKTDPFGGTVSAKFFNGPELFDICNKGVPVPCDCATASSEEKEHFLSK